MILKNIDKKLQVLELILSIKKILLIKLIKDNHKYDSIKKKDKKIIIIIYVFLIYLLKLIKIISIY